MKLKKIIVHGMMTSQNFGDVLLGQTTIGWLRELGCDEVLTAYASDDVQRIFGVRNAGISDYRTADGIVLSGGGYFQMMDRGRSALKRFVKNTGPLWAGAALGKPLAIVGVGMAPLPHGVLRSAVRRLFDRSEVVALRDPQSVDYAGALGLKNQPSIAGDLVFAHQKEMLAPELLEKALKAVGEGHVIALHLSDDSSASDDYAKLYGVIQETLGPMSQDVRFLLLEDHPSDSGSGPQVRAQRELTERLGEDRCIVAQYSGTSETMALLSCVDAVFSNKLHVGLAAAAMGTPPFSLAKNVKNIGSFADLGLADNCAMLDASLEEVRRIIAALRDCRTQFVVPSEIRARSLKNRELLANFLVEGN